MCQLTGEGGGEMSCPFCLHMSWPGSGLPDESGCDSHYTTGKICPGNSGYSIAAQTCVCPTGRAWSASANYCLPYVDRNFYRPNDDICIPCLLSNPDLNPNPSFGDPIYPLTGSRRQDVDLGLVIGGLPFSLTYDTLSQVPEASGGSTELVPPAPSFGALWESNLHKRLVLQSIAGVGASYSSVSLKLGAATTATAGISGSKDCSSGGDGGSSYSPTVNPNIKLQMTGADSAAILLNGVKLDEEVYDSTGAISTLSRSGGGQLNYSYTLGLLTSITDQFGRVIQFGYQPASFASLPEHITLVTAADGSTIQVTYDTSNNLRTLIWADGNVRTFVYENSMFPWALTGIVDEGGARYGTYGYDAQGRATSTALGAGVASFSATYDEAPLQQVTATQVSGGFLLCREHRWPVPKGTHVLGPNSSGLGLVAAAVNGSVAVSQQTRDAGSGSVSTSSASNYDSNGNLSSYDDFNGNRDCFAYDSSRNLPVVTLEGLLGGSSGKACPGSLSSYTPSVADAAHPERKTTTVWHPDWVLKAREASPKKISTWVYNGQVDPVAGTTASCAPSTALLPDGKPIAVLCTHYEQATTDATGALALSATVTGATRTWTYTYNQYGQVLTETTPKQSSTDTLSHTTTYAYYAATSFSGSAGYTMGDLYTVTNPLGQVTTYTSYDKAGRLLSSTDANKTVTSNAYWPRGWLHTTTVTPAVGAALTTTYDYWPTGLLKTVTMPDASTLNYAYDDAHRLTDVVDAAGNKVHYVLDNMGNRTSEQVSDASGNLAGTVARVYDALNRVQTTTGALH
jgi:YD repeat-containing protein